MHINVIRHIGKGIPQDIARRRRQTLETMRRMGAPVLIKHRYNDEDVKKGIAEPSPNFDDVYGQTRNEDPISHGVGFVSVEKSEDEWISPNGLSVITSEDSPGLGYELAPKYRGYGPGYLTYIILPDATMDLFKVADSGVLIQVQDATVQAPWYPEINDNDLIIACTLGRGEKVTGTQERYEAKMTNPTTMRGYDRRGRREFTEDGGNRFMIGQSLNAALVPKNNVIYNVEVDR